jgi:lauroyl/myristoyl acyltransferase
MKFTLMRLAHRTPGLRALTRRIHPGWFFKLLFWGVRASSRFWPHAKRAARPLRTVLAGSIDGKNLDLLAQRYLLYFRLFKDLEVAWPNWEHRHREWVVVHGENHLKSALERGKGAVLVSPHNYGFSKLVAPVLARRGYQVYRGGRGKSRGRRLSRWGKNYRIAWRYLDYRDDYWHHLKALKAMQMALGENGVLHVSPRAYRKGDEAAGLDIFGEQYFLDFKWFRLFEILKAPVLPCFAIAGSNGIVGIAIHPPLSPRARAMAGEFAEVQRKYLVEYPEFARFWSGVYRKEGQT